VVARLNEPMFDLNKKVTADMLRDREIAIHGSKQFVIDKIMKMRAECGYEDFYFMAGSNWAGSMPRRLRSRCRYPPRR
jgi:hypothetical protein